MREIKFTASGSSSTFGSFAPGDLMRLPDAAAEHFVKEASAAVYVDTPPAPAPSAPQTSATADDEAIASASAPTRPKTVETRPAAKPGRKKDSK